MTTPAFNPIGTLYNSIRYYTQFDPYYYTIDNRPLTDIVNNITTSAKGIDAGRRSVLIETLNRNLEITSRNSTATNFLQGLSPSSPASLNIRIGVGEVLVPLAINNSISQVVLKRAINQTYQDMVFTAPVTNGESVVYTVEGKYLDIDVNTPSSTHFYDSSNTILFDTTLNGVLSLQLKQGTSAPTGSEVAPSTTAGWFPIYNFHVTYAQSTWYKIYLHPSAPKLLRGQCLYQNLDLRLPSSGGGTSVTTYDPLPGFQLADSATSAVAAIINLDSGYNTANLYKDIRFDLYFGNSTNTGNVAMRVDYAALATDSALTSISYTSNSIEAVAVPATANTLGKATLTGTIPGSVLQTAKKLIVKFTGVRTDGADTNAGNMIITGATAYQSW